MKKIWSAGAIVLGVPLAVVFVIWIGFPGLFTYISVKQKYENIDRTISQFESVAVPDEFRTVPVNGIRIAMPEGYQPTDSAGNQYEDTVRGSDFYVAVIDADENPIYSLDARGVFLAYEAADYQRYFRRLGVSLPDAAQPISDPHWYWTGALTAKDCLHLRGSERRVFLEFADRKELAWDASMFWCMQCSGGTVYIRQSIDTPSDWYLFLYPESGGSEYREIMLWEPDAVIARQIVSSVSFAEEA